MFLYDVKEGCFHANSTNVSNRAPNGPGPARPSPAHGLNFFVKKSMGWAGPTYFCDGYPCADFLTKKKYKILK